MEKARSQISLDEMGITGTKTRRAQNGGLLVQLKGGSSAAKAKSLAEKMRRVAGENAKISIPCQKTSLKLRDVDISISPEEIHDAIVATGGCEPSEVTLGQFRPVAGGMRTVVATCTSFAAFKVAVKSGLRVRWTQIRVDILFQRPLRCYRCLARGHVQLRCPSHVDRSRSCYRCGELGHSAGGCRRKPHCPICSLPLRIERRSMRQLYGLSSSCP